MRSSVSWLQEILGGGPLPLRELTDGLTRLGLEVEGVAGDVLTLNITPNRGDCLSLLGVAREVAVLFKKPLPEISTPVVKPTIQTTFPIEILAPVDCPLYAGAIVTGIVAARPTPDWMKARLEQAGHRSISLIVDITNYVMLELGQPLHAFDLSKLNQKIIVRRAKPAETLTLLDNTSIKLNDSHLVIADAARPQALAGVMGGLDSSVTEATTDIFLESAFFNPHTVSRQAQIFNIGSDAAFRFARGVDPTLPERALYRALALLQELGGGQIGPVSAKIAPEHLPRREEIVVEHKAIEKLLGVSLSSVVVEDVWQRLHLSWQKKEPEQGHAFSYQVQAPSHRFDLTCAQDWIEEVARVVGYDSINAVLPKGSWCSSTVSSESMTLQRRLSALLVNRDYHKIITYSFVEPGIQALLGRQGDAIALKNPITSELSVMRTSLWPGLLTTIRYNQHRQQTRLRLFEIGHEFHQVKGVVQERSMLAGAVVGPVASLHWDKNTQRVADFYDIKGDIEALLQLAGVFEKISFVAAETEGLHPGQSAVLEYEGERIGVLGALHPALYEPLDISGQVWLFELDFKLLERRHVPLFQGWSKYPEIRRDLALLIQKTCKVQAVLNVIKEVAKEYLQEVCLFDVYEGVGVPEGQKSIAVALFLQHANKTLQEEDVASVIQAVLAALTTAFQAKLRES